MVRSIVTTPPPRWGGDRTLSHDALAPLLEELDVQGMSAMDEIDAGLADYLDSLSELDPDDLSRGEALAFWVNLYNAGALRLAAQAYRDGEESVLRVPGAFDRPLLLVNGRHYSLDAVEHGKVRRFKDPRIHAALVCGSVSCPTLRREPYRGPIVEDQLEDQMRRFLQHDAATRTGDDRLLVSSVFAWYGADFVRPHRMPTLLPASRESVRESLLPWLPEELADWVRTARPQLIFMSYDWSLRCSVG